MPTIISIKEYPQTQKLLLDNNWEMTDYYELCCDGEGYGCAFLVTIEKLVTNKPNEAIIYILERSSIEGESWDETLRKDMNEKNFVQFILDSGYLSDDKGWDIPINEFWVNYKEIQNGISNGKNFELTKNGFKTTYFDVIQKEEILSIACFANKWNNRQYLVETKTKWAFFSWDTGA